MARIGSAGSLFGADDVVAAWDQVTLTFSSIIPTCSTSSSHISFVVAALPTYHVYR